MYRIQFKHESGREELLHESQYSYDDRKDADAVAEELNAVDNPALNGKFTVVFEKAAGEHDKWRH